MTEQKEKKQCDHQWKLAFTQYQYPYGICCTAGKVEYAYLFCEKCLRVKKVEVEDDSEVENDFFEKQITQELTAEIAELERAARAEVEERAKARAEAEAEARARDEAEEDEPIY